MSVRQMVAHCWEAKINFEFIVRKLHLSLVPADALDLHRWMVRQVSCLDLEANVIGRADVNRCEWRHRRFRAT